MGLDKAKEGKRERRGERGSGAAPSSRGGAGRGVLAWRELAEPLAGKPRGKNNLPEIAGCRGPPQLSPHGWSWLCQSERQFPIPQLGKRRQGPQGVLSPRTHPSWSRWDPWRGGLRAPSSLRGPCFVPCRGVP